MSEPTAKHREEAREIIAEYKQRITQLSKGEIVPCRPWLEFRLSLMLSARDIGTWRAVGSAPKDGERILLANAKDVSQGYWDREVEAEGGQCWRLDDPDMQRFEIVFDTEPTHWMPLPDPPDSPNLQE